MEFKRRVFRTTLDARLLNLIDNIKSQSSAARNIRDSILNFITQNATTYMNAFTKDEREEMEAINAKLLVILDYIDTNVPETPKE